MAIEIREANPESDAGVIKAIDSTFETDTIFDVVKDGPVFSIIERRVDWITKSFPLDDLDDSRRWDSAWLAWDGALPVGLVATEVEDWNRRLTVWHLYVSPSHRRRGIARRLLDVALEAGRARGARRAWLETSNVNVPGVRAYERLGFEIVGFDVSLYDNTEAEGEVALFLGRRLDQNLE